MQKVIYWMNPIGYFEMGFFDFVGNWIEKING